MKKQMLLILSIILCLGMLHAQNIAPQSINNVGTKMTQNNGSISLTVGELLVLTQTDLAGNSLGGGFTNTATSSTTVVSVAEPDIEILNVKVYPNPASDLVFVDIIETNIDWLYIDIYNLQGKLISSDKYAGISSRIGINTTSLNEGTYILNLKDKNGSLLGNYTLIKQ